MGPTKNSVLTAIVFSLLIFNSGVEADLFTAALVGIGTAGAVALTGPLALAAIGFTAGGITAGSMGATMMSAAAVASGGGVGSGSVVALLQSAGAAGISYTTSAAVGAAAGAASTFLDEGCERGGD